MLVEEHLYQLHRFIYAAWHLRKSILLMCLLMPVAVTTAHFMTPIWHQGSADLVLQKMGKSTASSFDTKTLGLSFTYKRQKGLVETLKNTDSLKIIALKTGILNDKMSYKQQQRKLHDIQEKWLNVRFIDEGYMTISFRYPGEETTNAFLLDYAEWVKHHLISTQLQLSEEQQTSIQNQLETLKKDVSTFNEQIESLEMSANQDGGGHVYTYEQLKDIQGKFQAQQEALFVMTHRQEAIKPRIMHWLGNMKNISTQANRYTSAEEIQERIKELKKRYTPHHSKIRALEKQLEELEESPPSEQASIIQLEKDENPSMDQNRSDLKRIISAYRRYGQDLDDEKKVQIEEWISNEDIIFAKKKKLERIKVSLPMIKQIEEIRKKSMQQQEAIETLESSLVVEQRKALTLKKLSNHLVKIVDVKKAHPLKGRKVVLYFFIGVFAGMAGSIGLILLHLMLNQSIGYTRDIQAALLKGSATEIVYLTPKDL